MSPPKRQSVTPHAVNRRGFLGAMAAASAAVSAFALSATRADAATSPAAFLRLASGEGSMSVQAANLFRLDDLDDVTRTTGLAERDLDALRAVAAWIKTFVA